MTPAETILHALANIVSLVIVIGISVPLIIVLLAARR